MDNHLHFNGIDLMELVKEYGTPLKFSYLPKISSQIQKANQLFEKAITKHNYSGKYFYCYCTKSSHFSFVLNEALKNNVDIETSSAFDLEILSKLNQEGKFNTDKYIICNGFKNEVYATNIAKTVNNGFKT